MLGNDTIAGKGKVRLFAYSPGNPESNEIFTVTLAGNKQEGLEKGGE